MKTTIARITMSCALAALSLQLASAQSNELFGGFTVGKMRSDTNTFEPTMNGWNTSLTHYFTPRLGGTVDVAGFYGSVRPAPATQDISLRQYSFMAGPQFRLLHRDRFDTSLKALFGGTYGYVPASSATGYRRVDDSTFSALFGSNFDWNLTKKVALRFSPGMYLTQYNGETQTNFRFSVGPVFRFGGGEN